VVSGGWEIAASGITSAPTTEMSLGTLNPHLKNARITPRAVRSLPHNTAVGGSARVSSRDAASAPIGSNVSIIARV